MIPPVASRFVAGETAAEAIAHVRELNERNVGAIMNLLGEHHEQPGPAAADREAYCRLLEDVAHPDLRARISIKPTQLGLDVGEDTFRTNARRVVSAAEERGAFVWFDMEDHTTTDATLDVVESAALEGAEVGVCLQANLRRTREDLDRLAETGAAVRLVKGAYDEPERVAYQRHDRVNEELRALLEYAYAHLDGRVAVGSHDPAMIEHAIDRAEVYGRDPELQLLMGVNPERQYELAEEHDVWQYVPYGDRWLSYFYRRIAERKENVLFAARAILGR